MSNARCGVLRCGFSLCVVAVWVGGVCVGLAAGGGSGIERGECRVWVGCRERGGWMCEWAYRCGVRP